MLTITDKEIVSSIITIEDLEEGDLFLYDSEVYMKIKEIENVDGDCLNAVAFERPCLGECLYVHEDDAIIPLNGELIIERKKMVR